MTVRAHRDAGTDGVTVITGTGSKDSGYAAFADAGPIPHTGGAERAAAPVAHGCWQAVIPEGGGDTVITRWDLATQIPTLEAAAGAPLLRITSGEDITLTPEEAVTRLPGPWCQIGLRAGVPRWFLVT
jgi:hypothetical protein